MFTVQVEYMNHTHTWTWMPPEDTLVQKWKWYRSLQAQHTLILIGPLYSTHSQWPSFWKICLATAHGLEVPTHRPLGDLRSEPWHWCLNNTVCHPELCYNRPQTVVLFMIIWTRTFCFWAGGRITINLRTTGREDLLKRPSQPNNKQTSRHPTIPEVTV